MNPLVRTSFAAAALGLAAILGGCERPPVEAEQTGYRGTAMAQVNNPRIVDAVALQNVAPPPIDKVDNAGRKAREAYQNVQVLGDLDENQFIRLMTAITEWVSPDNGEPNRGCAYCHNLNNLAEDSVYTKIVARKMLQMTQAINTQWKSHVVETGVTCHTCHRGQPIPANIWFNAVQAGARALPGERGGQTASLEAVGLASLPYDPFTPLLERAGQIRIAAPTALPEGHVNTTQGTEATYSLMMHMSKSLGVNCTFCHNSRSFTDWEQSRPQRALSWYAIRMVRDVNQTYVNPLAGTFPPHRLGPSGDVAKVNCATCHQGAAKPLLGVSMVKDYPELAVPPVK